MYIPTDDLRNLSVGNCHDIFEVFGPESEVWDAIGNSHVVFLTLGDLGLPVMSTLALHFWKQMNSRGVKTSLDGIHDRIDLLSKSLDDMKKLAPVTSAPLLFKPLSGGQELDTVLENVLERTETVSTYERWVYLNSADWMNEGKPKFEVVLPPDDGDPILVKVSENHDPQSTQTTNAGKRFYSTYGCANHSHQQT